MIADIEYARPAEVAHVLGVHEETVRRYIARGVLPSVKFGGRILVPRAQLAALLRERLPALTEAASR